MAQIAARDKGIATFLDYDGNIKLNEIFQNDFVRRLFLPYCFHRMYKHDEIHISRYGSDIRDLYPFTYLPLNRRYKPIGVVTNDHVQYEDYPLHIIRSKKPFFTINNVFHNDSLMTKDTKIYWMYNDGLESRVNYCARLAHLMKYVTSAS